LTLDELNAIGRAEARSVLEACCGSSRWVDGMVEQRPFSSVEEVLTVADRVWNETGPEDWLEAFRHHPRIGERKSAAPQSSIAAGWSAGEQSSFGVAERLVQDQLAEINRRYEERFGYIYIVCASGKSADELLSIARSRMSNDPEHELRIAAEEQRKIMQLRLRKLLGVDS
jgi:OHCU decarboxylase